MLHKKVFLFPISSYLGSEQRVIGLHLSIHSGTDYSFNFFFKYSDLKHKGMDLVGENDVLLSKTY